MRNKIFTSKLSSAGDQQALKSVLRFSLAVLLMPIFCVTSAQAQADPKRNAAGSESNTYRSIQTRTRARRVTPAPVAESVSSGEKTAASTEEKTSDTEAPRNASMVKVDLGDPPPMTTEADGAERISSLRFQIEAAKTAHERALLQRKLVDDLIALDKKDEAVTELRAMAREQRFDPAGFYNTGNALARLGDSQTAVDAYRKAIEQRHGYYSRALNNLGVVLLRLGRWDDAQAAFVSALKQESFHYAEASYNLGRLYATRGEADLAIREWSRTLNIQPDHAFAALALARLYAEDGNPRRGVAVLDAFTTRHGPRSDFAAARREILSAHTTNKISSRSDNTESKIKNVSVSTGTKSDTRATAPPWRALTVDQETYDLLQRARASREKGRYTDAVVAYNRVIARMGGYFPPANLELSYALISLKRHREAIESLLALTRKDGPRYPVAYYHLGRLYEQQGQLSLAAQAYSSAVAAYGDSNPQFLLDLSRVREKEGDAAAALKALEDYVRVSERSGRAPDWTAERLAQLRKKVAASAQSNMPKQ